MPEFHRDIKSINAMFPILHAQKHSDVTDCMVRSGLNFLVQCNGSTPEMYQSLFCIKVCSEVYLRFASTREIPAIPYVSKNFMCEVYMFKHSSLYRVKVRWYYIFLGISEKRRIFHQEQKAYQ